ncbi:glycosyltransferase [Enterobacter cloacae subsp. cloacae]|nr:glycosyltransferase [Enterobacter cloacae subsp. cloacae]
MRESSASSRRPLPRDTEACDRLQAFALSQLNTTRQSLDGQWPEAKKFKSKQLARELGIEDKRFSVRSNLILIPWIKGARLLVLSSDCEGFGNVLVESIICQTPPVSTHCRWPRRNPQGRLIPRSGRDE